MYFGSDNQTGASDKILSAIIAANDGIASAYADDEYTQKAVNDINAFFDCDADIYFVTTGTAANSLALACMTNPWDIVLCHGQGHIINDELTAPEFFTQGARLHGLEERSVKLMAKAVSDYLQQGSAHPPHNAEPSVLSISQVSEAGQVYTIEEITELCEVAHRHGVNVHMDGARFANALASLKCSPADLTWRAGVDVLCLGATKNGALAAEAVIFFNKKLGKQFIQHRKRSGHLLSKGRWLGAQFSAWLDDDHWLQLANHANAMAQKLKQGLLANKHCQVVWPAQANEVFAVLKTSKAEELKEKGALFAPWPTKLLPETIAINEDEGFFRFVTSFKTTEAQVDQFLSALID